MDVHDLYEQCVQSPDDVVRLLSSIHGEEARVLGEDFCGTAAVSRAWVRTVPGGRAVALDLDARVLALARERAASDAIEFVHGDALAEHQDPFPRCDVVFVGNFSIGEIQERARLVAYLRRVRDRLAPKGVFAFDLYGGASAHRVGRVERLHVLRDGRRARYVWEQRRIAPLTGSVVNALHFRVEHQGEIVEEHADAFVYRWRLWTLPELADALHEAGFDEPRVWTDLSGRVRTLEDQLDESWIACVSARPR